VKASFFISAVAGLLVFRGHGFCQFGTRTESDAIIAAEREWAKAAVDHDIAAFAKYMSDDYVLIAVNARPGKEPEFEVTTKAKWVDKVRSGREKYAAVGIRDLKVLFNGDFATVTGAYSQEGTSDGKDISASGLYVDTWAKRRGQWQLINSTFP
jgi:ketosteroid isomerase-like protein